MKFDNEISIFHVLCCGFLFSWCVFVSLISAGGNWGEKE